MFKVGDKVTLDEGIYPFAGVEPGQVATVTEVLPDYRFCINNDDRWTCHYDYWSLA